MEITKYILPIARFLLNLKTDINLAISAIATMLSEKQNSWDIQLRMVVPSVLLNAILDRNQDSLFNLGRFPESVSLVLQQEFSGIGLFTG